MYSNTIGGFPPHMMRNAGSGGAPPKSAYVDPSDLRGVFYPRRLTYSLSALKIIVGCGMVIMGAIALYLKASYARSAAGLWTGIIVIISGVLGAFTVRMNASRAYVLIFFAASVISMIADVIVIIYSATGLAKDSGFPGGFIRDEVSGDLIPVSQVNIPAREKAMLANLLLIILGVLEVLFTLPSFIICLREVCLCYSDELIIASNAAAAEQIYEPRVRNDWLMSWLGQQPPQQQQQQHAARQHPVFFSGASGHPYTKVPAGYAGYAAHPHMITPQGFVLLPTPEHSHSGSQSRQQSPRDSSTSRGGGAHSRRSKSPNPHTANTTRSSGRMSGYPPHLVAAPHQGSSPRSHYSPLEIYPPPQHFYFAAAHPGASYPSPGSNLSHPASVPMVPIHGAHHTQWMYGAAGGDEYGDYYQQLHPHHHHHMHRPSHAQYYNPQDDGRRRSRGARSGRHPAATGGAGGGGSSSSDVKRRKKKSSPTDSDIDKTYTGLDRELAEEFIEQTMDPNVLLERKAARSGAGSSNVHSDTPATTGSAAVNFPVPGGLPPSGTESEAW